jgi:hypothetical protein
MADIRILCVEKISFPIPGEHIIIAACGEPVVPDSDNLLLLVHDAGPNLGGWVLAAFR